MLRFGLVCGCTGLCHTIESDIFLFLLLSWQIRDTGRCGKTLCWKSYNHVLRYRKLLMDDKSGIMKYQTGSHDGIISFILNGREKSVHVQDDKVFVCDTDSKRKKLNTQVKEHHRRTIAFDSPEKQITQNATHKIMRVPIRKVAILGIRKHLKVTRETSEVWVSSID